MTLSAPREKVARRKARELLQEVGANSLPIDPFDIARKKQPPILIVERDLPAEIYGACSYRSSGFIIAVSTKCPTPGHRRFTAGHELGHYHLPDHLDRMFAAGHDWVVSKGGHFQANADPIEREADFFASELLMPESLVRGLLRGKPGLGQVRLIADRCEVSLGAAAITMSRINGEPVGILISKDGVLEWPSFSPALSAFPWARARVKGEWAPPKSCTRRLGLKNEAVARCGVMEGEGLLCEWFEGAPAWVRVTEEAIGLGNYGRILTILRPHALPDPDQEQERSWKKQREGWSDND